jgi:hypothetical protein
MLSKFSKYLPILAVVLVSFPSVFAQIASSNQPTAKSALNSSEMSAEPSQDASALLPIGFGPALHAPGRHTAGTEYTYNWDGYAVTGTDFTSVKGSWRVPAASCSLSPNSVAAVWVGIDGANSSTVEQTGTWAICDKTSVSYTAWYEFYPAGSVVISSVPINPGDVITAEISYKNSEFTAKLTDETTGKTFSVSQSVAGAARSSAEWIVEAPEAATGIVNLADFHRASFGDDYTGITGTSEATDSAHSGPISAFGSSVSKIVQIDWLLNTQAVPSDLSSDGTSFFSTWVSAD